MARRNRPSPLLTLVKLIGAIVLTGVIAAGFFLPYVAGVGMTARWGADKFLDTKCDLVESPVAQTTTIYASDGTTEIAQLFSQNRTVIPIAQIPTIVQQALVGTEDRRFYQHHGVDLQGLIRAAWESSGSNQQGASTLTEQYVKQVRLYQATTDQERADAVDDTVDRKIYEASCAIDLEKKNTKAQILEKYLNIAFFGENAYGIEAAAETYFSIPASQLSLPQAAMIVGLVQSPTAYNPFDHIDAAKTRRDEVIQNMVRSNYITQADADAAKATPIQLGPRKGVSQGCAYANAAVIANVGFFCDYAYNWLTSTGGLSVDALKAGGWKIITTLDANLQNTVQASISSQMPADTPSAVVMPVVDPTTGAISAMATSRTYGVDPNNPGATTGALFTDATAGTGSTYKYFTMLAALKAGADANLTLTTSNSYTPKHCSQTGSNLIAIHNASNGYAPTLNLRDAAVQSSNTYFVGVEDQVFGCDLSPIVNTALALGVNSLNDVDPTNSNGASTASNVINGTQYTFTLGQTGTSPLELTSAYGTIANDGVFCQPDPIVTITDATGQPVKFNKPACAQEVDPLVARSALDILVGDTKGAGGTSVPQFSSYYSKGGSPIAGKTGTNNSSDAAGNDSNMNSALWFVGVTPHMVAATALFNPQDPNTPILDAPGHVGQSGNAFGAVSAGIWSNALSPVLLTQPAWSWPSKDAVTGLVNVPFVTGSTPAVAAQKLQAAGFTMFTRADACKGTAKGTVASQSPARAVPGESVMVCVGDGSVAPTPTASPTPGATDPAAPPTPAPNPNVTISPGPR